MEKETISSLDEALKSAHSIFKMYDKDNSGVLEKNELLQLLQACDVTVSENECRQCLEDMDQNGDGVWDFVEFMTFLGIIYSFKLSMKKRASIKPTKNKKSRPPIPKREDSLKEHKTQN